MLQIFPDVILKLAMNSVLLPAQFLLNAVGHHGKFYIVAALLALNIAFAFVAESAIRMIGIVGFGVASIYFLFALKHNIAAQFRGLKEELRKMGSGDLSVTEQAVESRNSVGAMSNVVTRTRDNLSQIVLQVNEKSVMITRSTSQLRHSYQRLADRTEH